MTFQKRAQEALDSQFGVSDFSSLPVEEQIRLLDIQWEIGKRFGSGPRRPSSGVIKAAALEGRVSSWFLRKSDMPQLPAVVWVECTVKASLICKTVDRKLLENRAGWMARFDGASMCECDGMIDASDESPEARGALKLLAAKVLRTAEALQGVSRPDKPGAYGCVMEDRYLFALADVWQEPREVVARAHFSPIDLAQFQTCLAMKGFSKPQLELPRVAVGAPPLEL